MNTNFFASLLRKESFGGTLGNAVSGKRIHITESEYQKVEMLGVVPDDLRMELKTNFSGVLIRKPEVLPGDNFSAPDIIFMELTRACNLNCTHCLNNSGQSLSGELTHKQRIALLDSFCAVGVQEIRFTGGEPLMIESVFDYIKQVRTNGLRASMGTNGVLIDRSVAKNLAESGLNLAVVSVDGLDERHDRIRGTGTFKKTLTGIELLQQFGIRIRVNLVAMKSNLLDIPRVVQYFYDRDVPIMIRRLVPTGRADGERETLSPEDYVFLHRELESLLASPKKLVSGHYLKEDEFVPRIKLPFTVCKCKAGRRGLAVLPDGKVFTCGFLAPLGVPSVGDLKTNSLVGIWSTIIAPMTGCAAADLANQNDLVQLRRKQS